MTTSNGLKSLTRRDLLKQATAVSATVLVGTGFIAAPNAAWAAETNVLAPETMATLVQMARDIYPHDQVGDEFYVIAVKGYDTDEAAEGIARQMARQDPERTASWLDSLGDNPDLDGARRIFLSESTDRDPQVALENVYTLSKESDQAKMYSHILSRWSRNNKDDARLWVIDNSATLPDNLVKKYSKPRK